MLKVAEFLFLLVLENCSRTSFLKFPTYFFIATLFPLFFFSLNGHFSSLVYIYSTIFTDSSWTILCFILMFLDKFFVPLIILVNFSSICSILSSSFLNMDEQNFTRPIRWGLTSALYKGHHASLSPVEIIHLMQSQITFYSCVILWSTNIPRSFFSSVIFQWMISLLENKKVFFVSS